MTQAITGSKLTFEEYLELPQSERRVELVNGELVELNPPRQKHHRIQRTLDYALSEYAKQTSANWEPSVTGQGVQISDDDSYIPDLVVVTAAQWEALEETDASSVFLLGNPPLLVIEVVSPSSGKKDTESKLVGYAIAKVPEYWIVNPTAKTVAIWILDGEAYTCKGTFSGGQRIKSELVRQWSVTVEAIYLHGGMSFAAITPPKC
ncbi:MAG: Uma2 family endonuclease [Cyanobacteria bacterium J06626_18]